MLKKRKNKGKVMRLGVFTICIIIGFSISQISVLLGGLIQLLGIWYATREFWSGFLAK